MDSRRRSQRRLGQGLPCGRCPRRLPGDRGNRPRRSPSAEVPEIDVKTQPILASRMPRLPSRAVVQIGGRRTRGRLSTVEIGPQPSRGTNRDDRRVLRPRVAPPRPWNQFTFPAGGPGRPPLPSPLAHNDSRFRRRPWSGDRVLRRATPTATDHATGESGSQRDREAGSGNRRGGRERKVRRGIGDPRPEHLPR